MPLAGLPPGDRSILRSAPVEVALAEIRFTSASDVVSTEQVLELQEFVRSKGVSLTSVQPAQQQEMLLQVTPAGANPEVHVRAQGWQMSTDDGHLLATVWPGSLALQTSQYKRWSSSLRPALAALIEGLGVIGLPQIRQRIGLRYVNRLVDTGAMTPRAWEGRISEAFLGPILQPALGGMVTATQQQVSVMLGEGQGALLRHGAFRDGSAQNSVSYLLDVDVFDESACRFSPEEMIDQYRQLNRTALSIFQQVVLPEYRATLQPWTDPEEETAEGAS